MVSAVTIGPPMSLPTEQTVGVSVLRDTGKPEEALAMMTCLPPTPRPTNASKAMVWLSPVTWKLWLTVEAAV